MDLESLRGQRLLLVPLLSGMEKSGSSVFCLLHSLISRIQTFVVSTIRAVTDTMASESGLIFFVLCGNRRHD
jgi:hypothetical protein